MKYEIKNNIERTPGKWVIDYTSIRTEKGLLIATAQIIQNAEFICKAVNNHDKLIETLREGISTVETLMREHEDNSPSFVMSLNQMRRALASIQKEQEEQI